MNQHSRNRIGPKRWAVPRLRLEDLERRDVPSPFSVSNTNDTGLGSLRQAILDANGTAGADTISFGAGLSGQTIAATSAALPTITDALTITGLGKDLLTINGNNAFRVFDLSNAGVVTISDLTIRGGKAAGSGGGINNSKSDLTLASVTIVGNTTPNFGGGVFVTGSGAKLTVLNSLVSNNTANGDGGGIFLAAGLTSAITGSAVVGNVTINSNAGAGISNDGGMTITNCTIAGNVALASSSVGGGVQNKGVMLITGSTISGNTASAGGGISMLSGAMTVHNSTIAGNIAFANSGGGVRIFGGSTTIVNSTIAMNADTGNVAGGAGGIAAEATATLTLANSIVALNAAGPANVNDDVDPADIDTNNDNFLGGNPRIGPLQDNGGPTFTMRPFLNSPVLNAGTNAFATQTGAAGGTALTTDQLGLVRIVTATVDQGAVEFSPPPPPVAGPSAPVTPTIVVNSLADGTPAADGKLTLREAVTAAVTNAASGDAAAGTAGLDVIGFDKTLFGKTIALGSGQLVLSGGGDVQIVGPGGVASGITINSNFASRIFNITNAASAVTVRDLTITKGLEASGGGILNAGPNTSLSNVAIEQNTANDDGGGIQNTGTLTITDSTLSNNTAINDDGGGIQNDGGKLTVVRSRIVGNFADKASAGTGGGIDSRGVGVITTILDSTVAGNVSAFGGGLGVISGELVVRNSTISGNRAAKNGGGVSVFAANAKFINSTIASNICDGDNFGIAGGGIDVIASTAPIVGSAEIINSTIVGNASTSNIPDGAGGISAPAEATMSVVNTMVALNFAAPASVNDNVDPADLDFNTNNFLSGDPRIGPLHANGGPTFTMLPFPGSPVINAGNNAGAGAIVSDQRGFTPRIAGGTVDIGAVETGATLAVAPQATLFALGVGPNVNKIVRFDATSPGTPTTTTMTGLGASVLVGIDIRPATAELIGLGVSGNIVTLFRINPLTGAAVLIGSATVNTIAGAVRYGIDFNPVTDELRVVNNLASDGAGGNANNFRLNPTTGALVQIDPDHDFNGLPGGKANAPVVSVAYSNNFIAATTTTQFGLVTGGDRLVIHGGAGPGFPTLQDVGILGVDIGINTGFDIVGTTNTALAVLQIGGVSQLFLIELTTGTASALGQIGDGTIAFGGLTIALPTITLSADATLTLEAPGSFSTVTATLNDPFFADVIINLTLGGTAAGSDFTASASQITIPAGQLTGTITIAATEDMINEGGETVTVTLGTITNGTAGSPNAITITIIDDDLPPTVALSVTTATIAETGGVATVTATLSNPSSQAVTVNLTFGGTAATGDFTASATQITIPAGQLTGTITLSANADTTDDPNETVTVTLNTITNGTAGAANSVTTTIVDDDLPPSPPAAAIPFLIGGPTDGSVRLLSATGSTFALGGAFAGLPGLGVNARTAVADVTGDGVPDFIVGAGPGSSPRVSILNGTDKSVLVQFSAFEDTFVGGVFVAAADIDGDGKAEVIVTPDESGGPVVAIYRGSMLAAGVGGQDAQLTRFFGIAGDPNFRGGCRPALADLNGDGAADLVVSAGVLGGPRIAIFDGQAIKSGSGDPGRLVGDFFAFEDTLRNGAFLAAGDVTGDGRADVAFGGGPGGAPRVRVFDGAALLSAPAFSNVDSITGAAQRANFFAGDAGLRGGVRLALHDADADGRAELLTGSGAGEASQVRVYRAATLVSASPVADQELDPFGATLTNGVFVG